MTLVDDVLRAEGTAGPAAAAGGRRAPWRAALLLVATAGSLHGATMGLWSGRALQVACSAAKAPLLLVATTLLCLPSFHVLASVMGVRAHLGRALFGIVAAQAAGALTLASLAPVLLVVYGSGCSYPGATLANGGLFLAATLAGWWTLARHAAPLVREDRRHLVPFAA